MERLIALARRPERLVVGLNSGTSADGIDAALVRCRGAGPAAEKPEVLAFRCTPHPAALRAELLRAPNLTCEDVCRLNVALAEAFAEAAKGVVAETSIPWSDVDLVGSHGQTVCHLPTGGEGGGSTLQIGDLDVLAERLGKIVVGDFRAADVAAGGAGAPLMPYLDLRLFGGAEATLVLNLGGIAALTFVADDASEVVSFDVGPCNVALDLLAAAATGGTARFDDGGALAAKGRVIPELLDHVLAHPFFGKAPPKTTGREVFGAEYVRTLATAARAFGASPVDLLSTHTASLGVSIGRAVESFVPGGRKRLRRVLCGGGGTLNATLISGVRREFPEAEVRALVADDGASAEAKEAVLFAVLANDRLSGAPTNVPKITGARRGVSLGKIAGG